MRTIRITFTGEQFRNIVSTVSHVSDKKIERV